MAPVLVSPRVIPVKLDFTWPLPRLALPARFVLALNTKIVLVLHPLIPSAALAQEQHVLPPPERLVNIIPNFAVKMVLSINKMCAQTAKLARLA